MQRNAIKRIAASGSLTLLVLFLCRGEAPSAIAVEPKAAAVDLVALTNISRTSNGLPALLRDSRLATMAVARSQDMLERNYFAHQIPPDGATVVDLLESLGVPFRSAGENIAWNNAADFTSVQTASEDFMNSLHHRQNVLDPRWNRMDAGVGSSGDKKMYAVLFLETLSTRAPARGSSGRPPVAGDRGTPSEDANAGASGASFAAHADRSPAQGATIDMSSAKPSQTSRPSGDVSQLPQGGAGLVDSIVDRLLHLFLSF